MVEVDRVLAEVSWKQIEPFAVGLLTRKERICCVCGKQGSEWLKIDGLNVRDGRYIVGMLFCPEHGNKYYYKSPDGYLVVNGLMQLQCDKAGQRIIKETLFNVPWKDFEKTVASRCDNFVSDDLRRYFSRGVGHLCWKSVSAH
jgi:hypothetical protein